MFTRNKLKSTVFYYPDTDFTDIRSRALESVKSVLFIREEQELSPAVTIILLHSLSFTHLLSHFISDSFFHIIHFLYLFR